MGKPTHIDTNQTDRDFLEATFLASDMHSIWCQLSTGMRKIYSLIALHARKNSEVCGVFLVMIEAICECASVKKR